MDLMPPGGKWDPDFLLDQLAKWPCARGEGWVFGLEEVPGAEAFFAQFFQNAAGSGVQGFVQPVWLPGRRIFAQMLVVGPILHATFRAALPGGHTGWGWFSWRSLNSTFHGKLEEAFGIRFLGDRLVPFGLSPASRPAPRRAR